VRRLYVTMVIAVNNGDSIIMTADKRVTTTCSNGETTFSDDYTIYPFLCWKTLCCRTSFSIEEKKNALLNHEPSLFLKTVDRANIDTNCPNLS
jgi:hypothetical protein